MQPTIFFIHIPKTAGMSLRNAIANYLPAGASLLDVHWPAKQNADPNQYQFVAGHVGFGYLRRFKRRPLVVTFLRDPIDRAVSQFYYYRGLDPQSLTRLQPHLGVARVRNGHEALRRVRACDLETFVTQERELAEELLGNVQTRYFMEGDVSSFAQGRPGARTLPAEASQNLENCDVVGLTERADESLALLCRCAGLPPLPGLSHNNVTRDRPAAGELAPRLVAALGALTDLDMQLYRRGQELLDERLRALAVRVETAARPWLGDALDFTFDQPICGHGWHPRDRYGATWFCWTGPEREAWLDLALCARGEHVFRCRVHHFLPRMLDGLQIAVNGQAIGPLRWQRSNAKQAELESLVPAAILAEHPGWARITFTPSEMLRPCDRDPLSHDDRRVGIAVSRCQLLPAAFCGTPPLLSLARVRHMVASLTEWTV